MKQPRIQEHFPSKKSLEAKTSDGEATTRKRKHPEPLSWSPNGLKHPVLCLSDPRAQPGESSPPVSPSMYEAARRARADIVLSDAHKPSGLSESTRNILAGLNLQRPARPAPTVEDILNSVPAREKHQGLMGPDRELQLPWEYKRLLTLFETCDSMLSYMKHRHDVSSFPHLKRAVESSCSFKFTEPHLQQMLTVLPGIYQLQWLHSSPSSYLLIVNFPVQEGRAAVPPDLPRRAAAFKARLLAITKRHHDEFLKTLPSRPQVNPERIQCWYHKFDVHTVPPLELTDLPAKPVDENQAILDEFLSTQTSRNEPVTAVLEEITENVLTMPHSKYLSPAIRAKIHRSALQAEESSELLQAESRRNSLLTLCEMLKAMFATHRMPSMFLENVVRQVRNAHKLDLADGEVRDLLREVTEIFPAWMRLVSTSMGEVLRMERRTELLMTTIDCEVRSRYS